MSQSFIDALNHFFSILFLPLPGKKPADIRNNLEEYFEKAAITYPVEECLKIYHSYTARYFHEMTSNAYRLISDTTGLRKNLLHEAGNKVQNNLYLQERLLVILALLEFNRIYLEADEENIINIRELSTSLNLSLEDFSCACDFVRGIADVRKGHDLIISEDNDRIDKLEGVWVEEHKPGSAPVPDAVLSERIRGALHFRYFERHNYVVFRFTGKQTLYLNDKRVWEGFLYSFRKKDQLHFAGLEPITYDEIEELFTLSDRPPKIRLSGHNIFFRYKSTHYSIKPFSFSEESGQLIGILGNNGSGKSTILKLISNRLTPTEGKIFINGADLQVNRYKLKSAIAYISQDDLLFPELTVFENMYYQAQLTLGSLSDREIRKRVRETLERFSLDGISNVTTGTENDHSISDFQRVCLRIAMEMLRNPYILFLDESLSGLSYSDARRLITIMKEETYKGKLIYITSPLPTAELFNMFDKVWLIDQDGYMIYSGEPAGSIAHFRSTGLLPYYYIQSSTQQVNPEDVIKIVETKKIDSDGTVSDERLVSPGAWYDAWRAENDDMYEDAKETGKPVPINPSGLPGIEKQFMIYLMRDFRVKFSNLKYVLLTLFGIPAAGGLIAIITRMVYGSKYLFSENEYLPMYIFLSVNFALFAGMLTGASEIARENKRIVRDQSLNLSFFSFQNSKVAYLLLVSAFQTLMYALTGNFLLGLKGMLLPYTITFFSLAAFGNLTALALSSGVRRVTSLYIVIPFLIIPNMLFSGYMIHFSEDTSNVKEERLVPLLAEFTPTRWAYEALMVDQYAANPYNRYFFHDEMKLYQSRFILRHILPSLESSLSHCEKLRSNRAPADSLQVYLSLIAREFRLLGESDEIAPFEKLPLLKAASYDSLLYNEAYGYLTYVRFLMENTISETIGKIELTKEHLADSLVNVPVEVFKKSHQNEYVEELVLNRNQSSGVVENGSRLIKSGSPVFIPPESDFGKARFFASRKRFNNQVIPVFRFNISMIWMLNLLAYILFLTNGMKLFLNLFRGGMNE